MQATNTQQQAQQSIVLTSKQLRARIFEFIMKRGAEGATNEEVSELLGIRIQTVCARRNELFKKHLIVDSGVRRDTRSGRSASVWIVPDSVRAALAKRSEA